MIWWIIGGLIVFGSAIIVYSCLHPVYLYENGKFVRRDKKK